MSDRSRPPMPSALDQSDTLVQTLEKLQTALTKLTQAFEKLNQVDLEDVMLRLEYLREEIEEGRVPDCTVSLGDETLHLKAFVLDERTHGSEILEKRFSGGKLNIWMEGKKIVNALSLDCGLQAKGSQLDMEVRWGKDKANAWISPPTEKKIKVEILETWDLSVAVQTCLALWQTPPDLKDRVEKEGPPLVRHLMETPQVVKFVFEDEVYLESQLDVKRSSVIEATFGRAGEQHGEVPTSKHEIVELFLGHLDEDKRKEYLEILDGANHTP